MQRRRVFQDRVSAIPLSRVGVSLHFLQLEVQLKKRNPRGRDFLVALTELNSEFHIGVRHYQRVLVGQSLSCWLEVRYGRTPPKVTVAMSPLVHIFMRVFAINLAMKLHGSVIKSLSQISHLPFSQRANFYSI